MQAFWHTVDSYTFFGPNLTKSKLLSHVHGSLLSMKLQPYTLLFQVLSGFQIGHGSLGR